MLTENGAKLGKYFGVQTIIWKGQSISAPNWKFKKVVTHSLNPRNLPS